jgi:tRNA(Ile)-lysidine synthase
MDADFLSTVAARFGAAPPARLGVAVSGGSDSVALLHILSRCFEPGRVKLLVATVDHGLRPEAAQEAETVAALAGQLGHAHFTLRWTGWDGCGNMQDAARRARYRLLGEWARSHRIAVLAVGHTADDQAETVLMRLARSAGVTGLAAMPERRTMHGITIIRPMLGLARADLRDYLTRNALGWAEDPSNSDLRYDRIKARRALQALAPLGLTVKALANVAQNMASAREALDWYSFLAARDIAVIDGGDVALDLRQFRTLPCETARRLLLRSMTWIGGGEYPPRSAALKEVLDAARQGRSATLAGCRILRHDDKIWICREYNAVRREICAVGDTWDSRWHLNGKNGAGCEVRPLGRRGLMACGDWRETGRPRAALIASPAVWRDDTLIAAPLAGMAAGWRAHLTGGGEEFFASLLSH